MDLQRNSWSNKDYKDFLVYLQSLADDKYKKFSSGIIPDTPLFFGIRVPELRRIAKEISKGNAGEFLRLEKGGFHEEIIIDGLVRAGKKCPYDEMLKDIIYFSGKIYNWSISDTVSFKSIKKYHTKFWNDKDILLKSDNPWQIRFGLKILVDFYLTDEYIDAVLDICAHIKSSFYYVNMMQAWLNATAAAKYPDKVMRLLENGRLDEVVFKMTVRKMLDSYRITEPDKKRLRFMNNEKLKK